jgi:branched-chain amino acid transport system substrate-binding protein
MRVTRWVALLAVVSLSATACGDDGDVDAEAPDATDPVTNTTGASGDSGDEGADCTIDRPMKFVGLAEVRGESAAAIDDFDQGWQLAVDEINAAGGVCGQDIEYERIATSPTDVNQAKNAFLQALDSEPDFVSGPISSGPVLAIAPDVAAAGIPVLYMSTSIQALTGNEAGSEWGFTQRPRNDGIAQGVAQFAVEEQGFDNIGLLCVDQTYGSTGCDAAAEKIEQLGAQVVGRETNAATAQDLTSQVLALRSAGAEAVLSFNFPSPTALFAKQMADNGFDVPLFGFTSASFAVGSGLTGDAVSNLWGTDDCAPSVDPEAEAFRDAYEAKHGPLPGTGYTVAEAYDAVMIAVQAVEAAGSLDPQAVADAMRNETFDGVCAVYDADETQAMHHSSVIISFESDGTAKVEHTLEIAS